MLNSKFVQLHSRHRGEQKELIHRRLEALSALEKNPKTPSYGLRVKSPFDFSLNDLSKTDESGASSFSIETDPLVQSLSMSEAWKDGDLAKDVELGFSKDVSRFDEHPLALAQLAFGGDGVVFQVRKSSSPSWIRLTKDRKKPSCNITFLFLCEAGSDTKILISDEKEKTQDRSIESLEIVLILQKGAKCTLVQSKVPDRSILNVVFVRAILREGAVFEDHEFMNKGSHFRRLNCILAGTDAQAKINQSLIGSNEDQLDLECAVDHMAQRTRSEIGIRGVLSDRALAIPRAWVHIDRRAAKAQSRQEEHFLMLSPDAEVDPAPHLNVEQSDVQCSHAATTSTLDPRQLFYLQSRGCILKDARLELISGFFEPSLQRLDPLTKESLERSIRTTCSTL